MGYNMYRAQCVLGLMALYVGLAHSWSGCWDLAAVARNQLIFYSNGTKIHTEILKTIGAIDKIYYDAASNRLFFTDFFSRNSLIFSCDIATMEIKSVVPKSGNLEKVNSMAFDPVEEVLFWSQEPDYNIYSISLKPGSEFKPKKISTYLKAPCHIALDICKRYIFWATPDQGPDEVWATIIKARFDGYDRKFVVPSNIEMPHLLVIDQQTQKLYWVDGTADFSRNTDSYFSIESADFDGQNRIKLYNETGMSQPTTLVLTKDYIYWGNSFTSTLKRLPKDPSINVKPEVVSNNMSQIFTNYKIGDQIKGIKACEELRSVLTHDSMTDNVCLNVSSDNSLYCVHGMIASEETHCKCTLGYTGERCEVSVCYNYCFNGSCSVSAAGQPTCRCDSGYSGERCEVHKCHGYCLNNGVCSLSKGSEPVCQCKGDYEGERCEVSACLNRLNKHFQTVSMLRDILNAGVTPVASDNEVKSTCASTIF